MKKLYRVKDQFKIGNWVHKNRIFFYSNANTENSKIYLGVKEFPEVIYCVKWDYVTIEVLAKNEMKCLEEMPIKL